MEKRVSLREAQSRIYETFSRYAQRHSLANITMPLGSVLGHVLFERIIATYDLPRVSVSAMDGYAVNVATFVKTNPLICVATTAAGDAPCQEDLAGNDAVRVFTGSCLPPSATSILLQEWVNKTSSSDLCSDTDPRPGAFLRPRGSDFKEGDILLESGSWLDSSKLQLAAASNRSELIVYRPLRCLLIAIGNELSMPGELDIDGAPHNIVASSLIGLQSLLQQMCPVTIETVCLPDDQIALSNTLLDAQDRVDLIFTLGGASAGEYDTVARFWRSEGSEVVFRHIDLIPGKPTWLVDTPHVPILSFPGNPVSMFVAARLLLPSIFAACFGQPRPSIAVFKARCLNALAANGQREAFLRSLHKRQMSLPTGSMPEVTVLPNQQSHLQYDLAKATCLTHREPYAPATEAGEIVSIILFDGFMQRL